MFSAFSPRERVQSTAEEIANSVSHGVGVLAAVATAPILIVSAIRSGSVYAIIGASVFSATMVLLFLASTIYHAMPRNQIKSLLQMFDRGAIFFLIAGTYTPFTLGVLRGPWGWSLLGIVWSMVVVGIVFTVVFRRKYPILKTCLYLAMGWLVVVAIEPLMVSIPFEGMFWLLVGGLAYTVGIVFYAAKQVRYSHFVWHLFVILGAACHFVAVLLYSAG